MSRIGRKPIKVPEKVKVGVSARTVSVEGPLGKLDALLPEGVTLKIDGGIITVVSPKVNRANRGFQGLARALLANMVTGVVKGYERNLEINGVGYKAEIKGEELIVSVGRSHLVRFKMPKGVKATLDKSQTKLSLKSTNKGLVGQFAAQVRNARKPEPYKGKGIKYAEEVIRRKVGKAGAK